MVPDEEPKAAPGQTQPAAGPRPRRSRRGGRRHSRRREPRPLAGPGVEAAAEPGAAAGFEERHAREHGTIPGASAVSQAIEQVTQVIEELKRALDEMEVVLETLELAERQKIDDEREIESLQRALRQLHRPAQGGAPRGR